MTKFLPENVIVEDLFLKIKSNGFPYYNYDLSQKFSEFNKLQNYKTELLIQNSCLKQTMHALGLAWSYFPHHWEVKVGKMRTPMEIWHDELLLKKAIAKRLNRGGFEMLKPDLTMTDSQVRKAVRSYSGVQAVSNFRPSAAAALYKKYADNGVVWDMSCGFGGRLIGALASNNVKKYIGTDPSQKTFDGLKEIKNDFFHLGMDIELHKCGSEVFIPNCEVDFCFTSPPYFNTEEYAYEDNQSFLAYNTVELWNEFFLRKTIKNCFSCLKKGKFLGLNVANVRTHKTLESDTIKIAEEESFKLVEIIQMQLSSIVKGGYKFEPIFIFQKPT